MSVAFELGKTLDEVNHLTIQDVADWLAYFRLKEKRTERALAEKRRRNKH